MKTPVVVLLHPLGADHSFWDDLTLHLDHRIVAPDLLGHGLAPLPHANGRVSDYGENVLGLLEKHRGRPLILVGVSLGGLVGQFLAAHHPERVHGLLLIDTVTHYEYPLREEWPKRAAIARSAGMNPLAQAVETAWFSDEFRLANPGKARAVRETFSRTDPEGYARTCEMLHKVDTRSLLSRISAPTLVVCGEDDAPPFVLGAEELATALSNSPVQWVPRARHASALEAPVQIAALIDELAKA